MSEVQRLRDDMLEMDRQIRRLRTQYQQVSAGDLGRADAIVGVLPSGNTPAHGSIGLWTNDSGAARSTGTVVIQTGDREFGVSAIADNLNVIGVVIEDGVIVAADGRIRHQGYQPTVTVQGAVVAGQFLRTSATTGAAEDGGATPTAGTFAIALTANGGGAGTVAAYLFGAIGGGGAGAGGWASVYTAWMPDAPPASPTGNDDEFNNSSFDGALWTEFDLDGLQTITEDEVGLKLDQTANAGDDNTGIYQSIPGGDFTITTKVSGLWLMANYASGGLALWDDAAVALGDMYSFVVVVTGTDCQLQVIHWNDAKSFNSAKYTAIDITTPSYGYLRIRRSGTTYDFDYSEDGIGWRQVYTTGALGFTPSHFGLVTNCVDTGHEDTRAVFDFFRYVASDVTVRGILNGDRIDMGGVGTVTAPNVGYTPAVLADWDGAADPGDLDDALDQLAERITDIDNDPSAAYTVTNGAPDRTYDADATSVDELADVLAALIADLQAKNILG